MRFTHVRTSEQVDLQALHRIRDQLIASRTVLINQMRAFCLEYGIAMRRGAGVFKLDLLKIVASAKNDLTSAMRHMLRELFEDMVWLDQRIAGLNRQIEGLAAADNRAQRLMTIPAIGALGVTASSRLSRMADSSAVAGIWRRGSAWSRNNTRREAR